MSPTRESSPAAHSPASSPGQLTPRSKVQALLASFDKDSDDESVSELARERVKAILSKPSPSKSNVSGRVSGATGNGACNLRSTAKDDTDDEEEEIVRPKGRLASRMQVNGDSSDEDAIKDGSLRIRAASESNAEDKSASGSDDNDSPVVSKKRKIRNGRKETPKSSPAKQAPSPGLFVSPAADKPTTDEGSDVDLPAVHNERFLALVQKQREKRLAREAEEEKQKVKKLAERKKQARDMDEDDDDLSDTAERRFTQPTRKASKKAQEEIRRETQRMSRNQQLAYNAVTKKKYAKSDFLAKFNFGVKKEVSAPIQPETSSSPALHSDFEMKDTPPTSPPSPPLNNEKLPSIPTLPTLAEAVGTEDQEEELPTLEDAVQMPSSPPSRLDKGKGRAIEEPVPETDLSKKRPGLTHRPVRVRVPKVMQRTVDLDCSDSDLEIVTTKTPSRQRQKLDSIFNRIPIKQSKESHSMHALRMLALVKSPPRKAIGKNKKPSITTGELQMSLQQRARQQAQREREERLQALRDKGIIIETPEEREKNQAEVEDIIAKARQEGEEIMMREKAAAKKERKANGEVDPLGESSDDEDWEEEKVADPELSASGSDADNQVSENDEEDDASGEEEDDEEMEDENATTSNPMFDNEADESDGDEEEADLTIPGEPTEWSDVDNEEDMEQPVKQIQRRGRKAIISDDEDSEADLEASNQSIPQTQSPAQPQWDSPGAPKSVLRSATKNFIPGITVAGAAGLGLTQIFAGTMDDSQTGEEDVSPTGGNSRVRQGGLDFLRQMPAPTLPDFIPTMEEDTQPQDSVMVTETEHIPNSQQFDSVPERIELDISQSQMHGFDSLVQDSQMSQLPDATQDVGFLHTTPIKGRFVEAPPSTVETVLLGQTAVPEATMETPIVKKKGKLRQRNRVAWFSDDEEVAEPQQPIETEEEFDLLTAFDVMRKASKKKKVLADEFDKKNSKAKDMVHEQADESEDEYAGLGGASDDESGGEMDELVKEMIDDEGGKNVDAGKLAAFFADRERASDEKAVEKLYKDITNGMLRRKRGADYDLSDSDDGGEGRKRRKRAEFAKMRKALLSDERIGKIAENPKRQAFLRAIEDQRDDDEMDFLDEYREVEDTESQSQTQDEDSQHRVPNSQPTDMGPPPPRESANASDPSVRPPAALRRTKPARKPANLSEVRESLSSLIEEPNTLVQTVDLGSDSEDELEIDGEPGKEGGQKENRNPFALRRTSTAVIDRTLVKRQSSSTLSASTRLAFSASTAAATFKVPALLRKATTNSSIASTTSTVGMERMAGGASDGVRRGGSRTSGVNFFARENERKANVVKVEKRREQKRMKGAEGRRKAVGGLLGSGKFE